MKNAIIPPNISVATKIGETDKLFAPSAARNAADIAAIIKSVTSAKSQALEIASGTGQHIVAFAAAMPDIHWHPTEIAPARLNSIAAYISESGLTNIAAPVMLNATQSGWSDGIVPKDLITLTNLLHLISATAVTTLIHEAAKALHSKGKFVIYGPFKRAGQFISDGDKKFDASIRSADPETGYKDDQWIKAVALKNGLSLDNAIEMAANNLVLVFQKN